MPSEFTAYIHALGPSGEPDPESFDRLWRALRRLLRSELKRRGLWESSPVLLGVHGWRNWWPGGTHSRSSDALAELASDCYAYIFVDRLRSLRAHLRHKSNIDGLVVRCVRNYLHDAQKRQDPLGFRLFSLVKTALRQLVLQGDLHPLAGGDRIGNDTVFGFQRGAEPAQAELYDLAGIVRTWTDELLGDLVAGRGTGEDAVGARIERRILALAEHGVEVFRVGDIIEPLKGDVRAGWAALFETEGERAFEDLDAGAAEVVRLVRPDRSFEERDSFDRLVACVGERLDRLEVRHRTRQYLHTLWQFLRTFSVEVELEPEVDAERMPSRRKLARRLGIPRDRFPELYETLQQLVGECFQAISGKPAVSNDRGPHER